MSSNSIFLHLHYSTQCIMSSISIFLHLHYSTQCIMSSNSIFLHLHYSTQCIMSSNSIFIHLHYSTQCIMSPISIFLHSFPQISVLFLTFGFPHLNLMLYKINIFLDFPILWPSCSSLISCAVSPFMFYHFTVYISSLCPSVTLHINSTCISCSFCLCRDNFPFLPPSSVSSVSNLPV